MNETALFHKQSPTLAKQLCCFLKSVHSVRVANQIWRKSRWITVLVWVKFLFQ